MEIKTEILLANGERRAERDKSDIDWCKETLIYFFNGNLYSSKNEERKKFITVLARIFLGIFIMPYRHQRDKKAIYLSQCQWIEKCIRLMDMAKFQVINNMDGRKQFPVPNESEEEKKRLNDYSEFVKDVLEMEENRFPSLTLEIDILAKWIGQKFICGDEADKEELDLKLQYFGRPSSYQNEKRFLNVFIYAETIEEKKSHFDRISNFYRWILRDQIFRCGNSKLDSGEREAELLRKTKRLWKKLCEEYPFEMTEDGVFPCSEQDVTVDHCGQLMLCLMMLDAVEKGTTIKIKKEKDAAIETVCSILELPGLEKKEQEADEVAMDTAMFLNMWKEICISPMMPEKAVRLLEWLNRIKCTNEVRKEIYGVFWRVVDEEEDNLDKRYQEVKEQIRNSRTLELREKRREIEEEKKKLQELRDILEERIYE